MDPPREGAQQQSEDELLQAAIALSLAEEAARAEAAGGAGAAGGADAVSDGSAGSLKRSLRPGSAGGAGGSDANSRRQRTAVRLDIKPWRDTPHAASRRAKPPHAPAGCIQLTRLS